MTDIYGRYGSDMSFWDNKNVFLTGCTGFLGSYMAKELVNQGANVTGLVRDNVPKSNLYEGKNIKESILRFQ